MSESFADLLAEVADAERKCLILHALEVACGAFAVGVTSEELQDARERRARAEPVSIT